MIFILTACSINDFDISFYDPNIHGEEIKEFNGYEHIAIN